MKAKAIILVMLVAALLTAGDLRASSVDEDALFNEYQVSFENVQSKGDILKNGFRIIEDQILDIEHNALGNLTLIPAISKNYNRLAFFFTLEDGSVVFKTSDFESNSWLKGKARQTNRNVLCIAIRDLNSDGLRDIAVVSRCKNEYGLYANKPYNVGDVLFQNDNGYYRDYRVSDKINRFDMNKDYMAIIMFLRDGISTEFLFTAKTLDELLENGFQPINHRRITEHFEMFGVAEIIPGFFNVAGQSYFMIYVVNESGDVLWNFQPMHYYENYYETLEISLRDIDGDGNKDFAVLARYVSYSDYGRAIFRRDYDIYYQRAGYFLEDIDFKLSNPCGANDSLGDIIDNVKKSFGEDSIYD